MAYDEKRRRSRHSDILGSRVSQLELAQSKIKHDVRKLNDTIQTKDNWHAEVGGWQGREVVAIANSGREYRGVLKWIDKYNIAIIGKCLTNGYETTSTKNDPFVLNKGCLESMRLVDKDS